MGCCSKVAVGHDGVSAYVKSLGPKDASSVKASVPGARCMHKALSYLHPSMRGVPPWFKIRIEAQIHKKAKEGICVTEQSFVSHIWAHLYEELRDEKHPTYSQQDILNVLRQRAFNYYKNVKNEARKLEKQQKKDK